MTLGGPRPLVGPGRPLGGWVIFDNALFLVLSVGSFMMAATTRVEILDGVATIVNPVRVYRVPLHAVESVTTGFWGQARVATGHRRVSVVALIESNLQAMRGGSSLVRLLRAEVEAAEEAEVRHLTGQRGVGGSDRVIATWRHPTVGLLLLLAAWVAFAATQALLV